MCGRGSVVVGGSFASRSRLTIRGVTAERGSERQKSYFHMLSYPVSSSAGSREGARSRDRVCLRGECSYAVAFSERLEVY